MRVHHIAHERHMRAGEDRQADDVDALLDARRDDLAGVRRMPS